MARDKVHSAKPQIAELLAAGVLGDLVAGVRVHPAGGSLTAYKRLMWRRYHHAVHLGLLDAHLERVTEYIESGGAAGIGRLIVAMPPRHGKSLTVSRLYPTWHLGRNPRNRLMLVSYGQALANANSRAARNLMRSRTYQDVFPGVTLSESASAVVDWEIAGTNGEGGAISLGIGGAATGRGAHLLIIDDPVKSRAEAESQTYRDRVWESYTDDLYTRLEPGGAVIVMATRWHEDDLTGRLLRDQREGWTALVLPALAGPDDALGRAEGAALWPERYDQAALDEVRGTLGPYGWSALYQQRPQPAEGGIFRRAWFQPWVRVVPEAVRSVRYWDLAMSSRESADYTVGVRMEQHADGTVTISDVARGQVELHDLARFVVDVMLSDGPGVDQGFENAGYMTRAMQDVVKDRRVLRYRIKPYTADRDKLTRALPLAGRASMGIVRVADRGWTRAFVDELASFPNAAHDDQVDAAAGAWMMLADGGRSVKVEVSRYA